MDRVRGGVFSGAMVLAGISATLLSALLAIGIRQVTVHQSHPLQVTMMPSSGQVAVPDATASAAASHRVTPTAAPAFAPMTNSYAPHGYVAPHSGTTASTGLRSAGGTVAPPAPKEYPTASKPPAAPSASPTPTKPGNGQAKGQGNGHPNGGGSGNGPAHKH